MRPLVLLWRFGRPHTLIGTTLSVVGVYVLVAVDVAEVGDRLGDLLATLVAAWSVNVFIMPGSPRMWSAWKWVRKICSSSSSPTERSS